MSIKEKTSYLKGLLEGLNIDSEKPEGKLIAKLVEVVDEMAEEIEALGCDLDTCNDYIEEIDEDLGDLEEIVYDIDEDDDECDCCDCCDCDDEDGDYFEAQCPNCGEMIYFSEDTDPEEVVCPACQKPLITEDEETEGTEE